MPKPKCQTAQENMLSWLELMSADEGGRSYKAEMAQRALAYMRELEEKLYAPAGH